MSEVKYELQRCFHCGNEGLMYMRRSCKYSFGSIWDNTGNLDFEEGFEWFLLSCPACN